MFIKLTNAVDGRQDYPIHINVDHIIAVYEDHTDGGSLITKVYGQTGFVWTVQESLSEVVKMLTICALASAKNNTDRWQSGLSHRS